MEVVDNWSNILSSGDLDVWSNRAQPWQLSGEISNKVLNLSQTTVLTQLLGSIVHIFNFNFQFRQGLEGTAALWYSTLGLFWL